MAIPQNSRVVLPEEVFASKVKIAGREVKISDLVTKYRTKSFKVTPKGPGQLVSQFELAELSYGSYEATVSDRRKGTFKLLRQPVNSTFYKDRWISASPYGIRVFDKSGKPLWRVKKPLRHRIAPNFGAVAEGINSDKIIEHLLETIPQNG